MRLKKTIILLLILSKLMAAEIPVEIDNDVYKFIFLMENRKILSLNSLVFPYSRQQIANLLKNIDNKRSHLQAVEREILDEYLADYRYELTDKLHEDLRTDDCGLIAPFVSKNGLSRVAGNIFTRKSKKEQSHLFTYENKDVFFWGDFGLRFQNQWKDQYFRYIISDSYKLQGQLSQNLFFHINFFRHFRKMNANYDERVGPEIGNLVPSHSNYYGTDNVHSSFVYSKNNFRLGLYHQPIVIGTSLQNSTILSAYGAPYTYLGFDYQYKALKFTLIHGSLLNDSTAINRDSREKYIAAHRLELNLFSNSLNVGITDIVIYGDRNVEPGYLLPVNFYWSIGHTLMDRDNSLIAFDFRTNIVPNFILYGSLLLDELKFSELFNNWWANKQAIQVGGRYSHYIAGKPSSWNLEMSFIRPWTYTHKFFINSFTNNGISLGFPHGGNSILIQLSNEILLSRRSKIEFIYSLLKHGNDTEKKFYGGNPVIGYHLRDTNFDNSTKWLMGNIEVEKYLGMKINYEIFNNSFINWNISKKISPNNHLFIDFGFSFDF